MQKTLWLRCFWSCLVVALAVAPLTGCRGRQHGHVLDGHQQDMVGSHSAGSATLDPLVEDAVAQLLARQPHVFAASHTAGGDEMIPRPQPSICFVGVENRSAEELGDFKQQIYQQIDTQILQSGAFHSVSKRFVDAGLRELRMRPDELFLPSNREQFRLVMEQMGQPFDHLLFATITSGTTRSNDDYQRDYTLTLELINLADGSQDKQSATVRKGYHRTRLGQFRHYNPFQRGP